MMIDMRKKNIFYSLFYCVKTVLNYLELCFLHQQVPNVLKCVCIHWKQLCKCQILWWHFFVFRDWHVFKFL